MSSGVSQIEYWRDPAKPKQANETNAATGNGTGAAGTGTGASIKEGGQAQFTYHTMSFSASV